MFEVTEKVDGEARAVDIVYMAFTNAFDKALHSRLLWKVSSHGIQREVALGSIVFSFSHPARGKMPSSWKGIKDDLLGCNQDSST